MMDDLPVLTLYPEHAELFRLNIRNVETRSWATQYRGVLLLHAGKRDPDSAAARRDPLNSVAMGAIPHGDPLTQGAVVAAVELVDCVPIVDAVREDVPAYAWPVPAEPGEHDGRLWIRHTKGTSVPYREDDFGDQLPYGDFTPGRWAWTLANIRPLPEPVRCGGHERLWDLARRAGPEVAEAVHRQLAFSTIGEH